MKLRPASCSAILLSLACLAPALSAQTTRYWGGGTETPTQSANDTANLDPNASGTWNATLANWNSDLDATDGWSAWQSGAIAVFRSNKTTNGPGSTITLNEDITAGGVLLSYPSNDALNQTFSISGSGTITLTEGAVIGAFRRDSTSRAGTGSGLNFNTVIAGDHGFSLGQNHSATLNAANTVSGVVRLGDNATLTLGNDGTLQGITRFEVGRRSVLTVANTASTNSLNDAATVVLNSSSLQLNASGNAISFSETIGSVVLEGGGRIYTNTRAWNQNPTVSSTLHLADGFDRGANGRGILTALNDGATGYGGLGTDNGLNITGHGFAANQAVITHAIVQGRYKNVATGLDEGSSASARFMATDADGNLRGADSAQASSNLAEWAGAGYGATSDIHVEITSTETNFSNALTDDVTLRTLAIGSTGNRTTTLNLGGNTLAVDAIAAVAPGSGVTYNLGSGDGSRGIVTAANGQDLTIIHERGGAGGTLNLHAVVSDNAGGAVNLILGGAYSDIFIRNHTTHTGKTYVNASSVTLGWWTSQNPSEGSLLSTSELNISRGSTFIATGSSYNTWGGGAVEQTLSGGGIYRANTRTVTIGANGTLAPSAGSLGARETFTFELTAGGKLHFAEGSTVALTLGSLSDVVAFTTAGDWLTGSGNFKLELTSGDGFQHGVAYTIFSNVTTAGFTPGSVWLDGTELDQADYTWTLADNSYLFTSAIPEPSAFALLLGAGALGGVVLLRRRR